MFLAIHPSGGSKRGWKFLNMKKVHILAMNKYFYGSVRLIGFLPMYFVYIYNPFRHEREVPLEVWVERRYIKITPKQQVGFEFWAIQVAEFNY